MTTTTVTNSAPVQLLAAGAGRWVSLQNQSGNTVRIKHDATGDAVGPANGYILRGGETLLLSDAPAASAITAQAEGGSAPVCVQTGAV